MGIVYWVWVLGCERLCCDHCVLCIESCVTIGWYLASNVGWMALSI